MKALLDLFKQVQQDEQFDVIKMRDFSGAPVKKRR